ncbi:hypothetical protein HPB47_004938 [Ixodes persulcatus]|uniref:Uncharacterized protein n=1 Tax=Ixodes persulcatus TaxID=34615 RepID=A0AC60PEB5_IXOPE|nr:hypothetical protein HPB47_004938 [Ixodes persulcatus]
MHTTERIRDVAGHAGWYDIGYNFLIGGNGLVFEGRGWDYVGAHTVGFNNKSVSLGFVGDYSDKVPNIEMLQAAVRLIEFASSSAGSLAKMTPFLWSHMMRRGQ